MKKIVFLASLLITAAAYAVSTHGNEKNAYRRQQYILQSDSISIAGAAASTGGSLKLQDLPEGKIIIHGVVANVLATCGTNTLVKGETLNFGVGTTANANGAWSATETNLGSAAIAFTSGVTRAKFLLDQPVHVDGTAAAADIYLNVYTTNALVTNGAMTVVGDVQVLWSQVGDY